MSIEDHKRIILKCIKNGAKLPAYITIYIYYSFHMHHVKPWQSLWLCLLIWATAAQVVHQWTHQRGGEGTDVATSLQVDRNVEQNLESFGLTGQFGTHLSSEL